MGVLSVNDLKDGMVLASEVKNKHGNILLKKGNMLSEKHIMLLKSWGITKADIVSVDKEQVEKRKIEELSSDLMISIEEGLKGLFPDDGDNPLMQEIYRIVKKFRMKQAMEQTGGNGDGNA